MRKKSHPFYHLLAGVLISLSASSCTSSSSNPDYKFQEGEVTKYTYQTNQDGKVTIDGEADNFNLHMANTVLKKTQTVDESGTATIDVTLADASIKVDGEEMALPDIADTSITYELNKDGVIQNVRGTNGLAGPLGERQFDPAQIFLFQGPMFREGTLKKGDKWQQTVDIPIPGTEGIRATVYYTYEGKSTVKGKETAKINFAFDSPMELAYDDTEQIVKVVGNEQMAGLAYFDIEDGKTVKANGKGPLTLSMSMPTEGAGQDIERVRVEVNVDFDYELQD